MSTAGKPLIVSLAGHLLMVAALIWLVGRTPPLPLPAWAPQNTVDVVFVLPQPAPPPIPPPPELTQREPEPPPITEPLQVEPPPPPAVAVKAPPPPPPKPALHRPPPHRALARPERPPPEPRNARPERAPAEPRYAPLPEPRYAPPLQTAALPPMRQPAPPAPVAVPSPTISASYRAELSAWLESHKQYPQSARERGEQGRVMLRFRVARSGRVLNYAVAGSSGYPDLDGAVETMMRGASLPPFPADMITPEIEVTVTVRFALTR